MLGSTLRASGRLPQLSLAGLSSERKRKKHNFIITLYLYYILLSLRTGSSINQLLFSCVQPSKPKHPLSFHWEAHKKYKAYAALSPSSKYCMKWTLVLALSPKFPIHLLFVDSGQQSAGCLIINYAADKQKGAGPATCHPCVGGLWCRWNHAYFIINLHWNSRFLGASFGFNWLCARFKHRDCFEPAFGPVFTALTLLAPGLCVALMSPEIYCSLLSVCRAPAPWIPHCVDTRSFWHLHLSRDNHGELPKSILALPKYSLLPFPHFPASSIIISNNKLNVRHPFTLTLCLWLAFTYFDIDSTFRDTNSRLTAPHLSSPLYAISSVASFRQKKSNLWISIDVIKLKKI